MQVKFLFITMVEEDSSITKSMALKCVRFLCSRGMSHIFFEEKGLTILTRLVNDPQTPPDIQCEVLKTLRQVIHIFLDTKNFEFLSDSLPVIDLQGSICYMPRVFT